MPSWSTGFRHIDSEEDIPNEHSHAAEMALGFLVLLLKAANV
jgi:hypothetical protein